MEMLPVTSDTGALKPWPVGQIQPANFCVALSYYIETHRALVLRGYYTPNLILACFVCYLKIVNTFLNNNVGIYKQIVQGTQKMHWNFSRPSSF